jgi:polysaccharide biosynthesis protein VpsM
LHRLSHPSVIKRLSDIHGTVARVLLLTFTIGAAEALLIRLSVLAQQTTGATAAPTPSPPMLGGQGILWLSQFANPALVGSLYLTPAFPLTGFYPLFPGALIPAIEEGGVTIDSLVLHPHIGVAQMYTDNVFRTNTNRQSDWFTTLSPGIQAKLPVAGRHMLLMDYRTNIQYYQRTPSNDVQDQTASGRFRFDFPGGLIVDLQGEHKLGHDPRGSALDIQALEVNKWTANSAVGQAEYRGAQVGAVLRAQTIRWNYFNNNQGIIRDRRSNITSLTLLGNVGAETFALANFGVIQENYDENRNLDSAVYMANTGIRWQATALTAGEILAGYQHIRFSHAEQIQEGVLGLFQRDRDAFDNFFLAGNLSWTPTSTISVGLQAYRTIQQTPIAGTNFFIATGMNLSIIHEWTDRLALTVNLGYENDDFSGAVDVGGATVKRSDTLKNAAIGWTYRAVKWLGASFQYVIEDRSSDISQFSYRANTFTVTVEALF